MLSNDVGNMTTTPPPAKPFLRWAGSKKKLLPILKSYWRKDYNRYIEPFAGSACLFFNLLPDNAILGDNNRALIETYIAVKHSPEIVYQKAINIPLGQESYYLVRSMEIETLSEVDRAARFIYLNRYCFNGLYRTNAKGVFNVPFSPSKTGNIPDISIFYAVSNALKNVQLIHADFLNLLDLAQCGDFVYLDPPYAVKNSKIFNQYGPESFGINDMQRLKESLLSLHKRKVHFVLSYANVEEANNLFKEWNVKIVKTQRNIAGFSKFRRIEEEIIVSNF